MGILDDLSAGLQGAVEWTFTPCVLVAGGGAKVASASGGWTTGGVNHDCMAKVDKKETRTAAGDVHYVTRILILRGSLAVEPAKGNQITGLDRTYKLGPVDRDGLGSHWICEVDNG